MTRWRHLAARFFDVLFSHPLGPVEQVSAARLLRSAETDAFWSQPVADQRHALRAAESVLGAAPTRTDLARVALLHDIGKRHSGLGPIGRSLAAVSAELRLPLPGRWRRYLDHGPLGADELAGLGAEDAIVRFARHHHGARPEGFRPDEWLLLQQADARTGDIGERHRQRGVRQ